MSCYGVNTLYPFLSDKYVGLSLKMGATVLALVFQERSKLFGICPSTVSLFAKIKVLFMKLLTKQLMVTQKRNVYLLGVTKYLYFCLYNHSGRLAGLVVVENPRFESCLQRDFSGSSHTSDFKIGAPVATLPGAWHYRVSAGTGRPSISIL